MKRSMPRSQRLRGGHRTLILSSTPISTTTIPRITAPCLVRFYVSADEWGSMRLRQVRHPASLYNRAWLAGELSSFSYSLVAHDYYDVLPGLRLIKTAGHTPGHQSVLVNTAEGVLCVTGDIVNSLESFALPTPVGSIPP